MGLFWNLHRNWFFYSLEIGKAKDVGLFFQPMALLNPFPYIYIEKNRLPPLCLWKYLCKYLIFCLFSICCFSQWSTWIATDSHHTPPSLCFTASSCAVPSSIAKLMSWACPAQSIGLLFWSSTTYLLWSDPALRLFPECRLQWASSHGIGPAFGYKINPTASSQDWNPLAICSAWLLGTWATQR